VVTEENEAEQEKAFFGEEVKQEITLEAAFSKAQDALEYLTQEAGELQKLVFEKTKEVHSLAEQVANAKPVETSQTAIQSYLRSEQGVLEERGVRLEMIARSGIKLKDLADNLKSPLDASLARKR
jgi:predicted RNase H-like nuclease (RuvC/YqgF family)